MEADQLSEAIQPLVEESKAVREILTEIHTDIQHLTRNAQDYLSVVADAVDEIRGEILARLRYDDIPKPILPPEKIVICARCDIQFDSLAEAVRAGFTDLQSDPEHRPNSYAGQCGDCAAKTGTASTQTTLF